MGKLNSRGFSAVEGLLVLVIIAIIGGTGFYVFNANKKTNDTLKTANQESTATTPKFGNKGKKSSSATSKAHTADEATTFVQKTYDDFLAAVNGAGSNNTQPLGLVGLTAVKGDLSADFYTKAAASKNGSDFSCAAQFVASKYTAKLDSSDKTSATVGLTIANSSDSSTTTTGMKATVDLASLKITAVTCPN